MALQLILDSLEGLSEETKALYTTASTGKFHLDVEGGAVSKLKHDEFRNSNINLKKEVEGLKVTAEKYKDVDMEKYDEAVAKLREIEEKKLIEEGDIEGIVTQRTDLMAKEHTKQVTKMTDSLDVKDTEIGNLQSTLALSMIKSDIITEINGVAIIAEGALPDVLARCEQDWRIYKMESGKYDVEPIDGEGQIRYGEDGRLKLSGKEYAAELFEKAPHLFEPSKGGGSQGGRGTNSPDSRNVPFGSIKGNPKVAPLEKIASGEITLEH